MTKLEDGYATLTVSALMGALSLLALGYTNLSISEARKVDAVRAKIELDMALDGAFHQVLGELFSRSIAVYPHYPDQIIYQGHNFNLSLQVENQKIDLNRAYMPNIKMELGEIFGDQIAQQLGSEIENRRDDFETAYESVSHLEKLLDDPDHIACLRDQFTLFRSVGMEQPDETDAIHYAVPGMTLRIQLEKRDAFGYRALDTIVLITGTPRDPFWVLDWQRREIGEIGECERDA
jgi:hypothetical protein